MGQPAVRSLVSLNMLLGNHKFSSACRLPKSQSHPKALIRRSILNPHAFQSHDGNKLTTGVSK
jgi:hypothetical protein